MAGAAIVMLGLASALAWAYGGSVEGGVRRAVSLAVWIVLLLQVLAQAGATTAVDEASLPAAVVAVASALQVLRFSVSALPSPCFALYPFALEAAQMGTALALSAALAADAASLGSGGGGGGGFGES